jgi:RimJ/RimL family protein N-acetyltransferase
MTHGESLMRAAADAAVACGCAVVKWQVVSWNAGAQRFYERLGAVADPVWIDFSVSGDSLDQLAARSSSVS